MDLTRHRSIFDPAKFEGRIAVAGLGAVGSALALQLAKLGLTSRLMLFDHDVIEPHNLPNQMLYGPEDVGLQKVTAASYTLESLTGQAVYGALPMRLPSPLEYGTRALFVCVDSMSARSEIFEACVSVNPRLTFFAEGRMNARSAGCFAFQPSVARCNAYRERLYPDSDVPVELGACGNTLSVGATATTLACQMTWALIRHAAGQPAWEEIAFAVDDLLVHQRGWLSDEHHWRRTQP